MPDTLAYLIAGYVAFGCILGGYGLRLWRLDKRTRSGALPPNIVSTQAPVVQGAE